MQFSLVNYHVHGSAKIRMPGLMSRTTSPCQAHQASHQFEVEGNYQAW